MTFDAFWAAHARDQHTNDILDERPEWRWPYFRAVRAQLLSPGKQQLIETIQKEVWRRLNSQKRLLLNLSNSDQGNHESSRILG
jgi:hypothetical protein